VAARMAGAFRNWRTLETSRQALARASIAKIATTRPLSRDVAEIATKMLA
jgi:Domain of unknown function (DUF3458_C) ARM repeats